MTDNRMWREKLRAKQDAISDAKPLEDRILMFKEDGPRQKQRVWQYRAQRGLEENPEWSAEKIAEEWGTSAELVEAVRSPQEWRKHQATHDVPRETYAERVAAELNQRKVNAERQAAFKRMAEVLGQPRASLWDRVRRAMGRDEPS